MHRAFDEKQGSNIKSGVKLFIFARLFGGITHRSHRRSGCIGGEAASDARTPSERCRGTLKQGADPANAHKELEAHSRETAVKKSKKGKGFPVFPELLEK